MYIPQMQRKPPPRPKPFCENCHFYLPLEPIGYDARGRCLRWPPHPELRQPIVQAHEWCGEHQPKAAPA